MIILKDDKVKLINLIDYYLSINFKLIIKVRETDHKIFIFTWSDKRGITKVVNDVTNFLTDLFLLMLCTVLATSCFGTVLYI